MEQKEEKLRRAISAYSRRQILRLLINKERTVKEISNLLKMSASLASRHLKLLHDLGFLKVRKKFPYKFYSLKIQDLRGLLDNYDKAIKPKHDKVLGEENLSRAINAYSRRKILKLISNKELSVKEIANNTKMSVSLASRHLKLLYDLGFLQVRKNFPNKFYSLKIKSLQDLLTNYDKIITKL